MLLCEQNHANLSVRLDHLPPTRQMYSAAPPEPSCARQMPSFALSSLARPSTPVQPSCVRNSRAGAPNVRHREQRARRRALLKTRESTRRQTRAQGRRTARTVRDVTAHLLQLHTPPVQPESVPLDPRCLPATRPCGKMRQVQQRTHLTQAFSCLFVIKSVAK